MEVVVNIGSPRPDGQGLMQFGEAANEGLGLLVGGSCAQALHKADKHSSVKALPVSCTWK